LIVQKRETNDVETAADEREAPVPGGTAATRGFSAQLRGASLWDLVQLECLSRSRRCIRVVGEGGVGYLFFDRGRVIHAATAQAIGEAAAVEVLAWTNGSFEACERPWPEQPSIAAGLEALLLRTAQLCDERAASNLVAFPTRPGDGDETYEELQIGDLEAHGGGEMRSSNTDDMLTPPPRVEISGDFAVVMRLGPTGAIMSSRGGSEELGQAVAYVERLLQLTGEMLGLGPFSALECTFTHERCLIFCEGGGETVALRPRADANLTALRERLGL